MEIRGIGPQWASVRRLARPGTAAALLISGGKQQLGRITKRGDASLRKSLVLGARSALTVAPRHDDADARWAFQLRERIGWPKACVALANGNARTL